MFCFDCFILWPSNIWMQSSRLPLSLETKDRGPGVFVIWRSIKQLDPQLLSSGTGFDAQFTDHEKRKKEDRMIKDKRIYKMIKDLTQNDTDLCWATVRRLFRPRSFRFYEAVTLKKSCLSLLSDQNCSVQASNCWTGLSVISLVCHVKLKNFACRISVWSVNVCLKGLRRLRRRRLPFGECQLSFQAPQQQPGQSKD